MAVYSRGGKLLVRDDGHARDDSGGCDCCDCPTAYEALPCFPGIDPLLDPFPECPAPPELQSIFICSDAKCPGSLTTILGRVVVIDQRCWRIPINSVAIPIASIPLGRTLYHGVDDCYDDCENENCDHPTRWAYASPCDPVNTPPGARAWYCRAMLDRCGVADDPLGINPGFCFVFDPVNNPGADTLPPNTPHVLSFNGIVFYPDCCHCSPGCNHLEATGTGDPCDGLEPTVGCCCGDTSGATLSYKGTYFFRNSVDSTAIGYSDITITWQGTEAGGTFRTISRTRTSEGLVTSDTTDTIGGRPAQCPLAPILAPGVSLPCFCIDGTPTTRTGSYSLSCTDFTITGSILCANGSYQSLDAEAHILGMTTDPACSGGCGNSSALLAAIGSDNGGVTVIGSGSRKLPRIIAGRL